MLIVLTGMPGAGKSYMATKLIYDAWKIDPDRKVFTNFPVRWKDKSSMKWKPEMVSENLQNSLVVIDEAYRDYNSRKFEKFSDDAHLTFATNRHNENTFIFISQNIARLDTVIREISEIWWISKLAIPNPKHFFEFDRWRPVWFKIEMYDCLDSFKLKALMGKKAAYRTKRHLFKKVVAQMYDTHYYGDTSEAAFVSEPWYAIEIKEKPKFSVSGVVRNVINRVNSLIRDRSYAIRSRVIRVLSVLRSPGNEKRKRGDTKNPRRRRKDQEYEVFEPRGIIREIVFRNWLLWKPIFRRVGIEKRD